MKQEHDKDFHARRRAVVGGSDCAAALGCSRFRTAHELGLIKLDLLPDVQPETEKLYFGRVMESVAANVYTDRNHCRVRRCNQQLRSAEYPWMGAHIDRFVVGARIGLECKNVDANAYRYGEWGPSGTDEVPGEYLLQAAHYAVVTGIREWHFAVIVGGNRFAQYVVHVDAELEQLVIEGERAFWQYIERGEPPPLDFRHASALPLLKRLYPGTDGREVNLSTDYVHWHHVRLDAEEQIKHYEAVSAGAKAHLLHAIGNAAAGVLPDGGMYRRKVVHRAGYAVDPCDYVDFRYVKSKE
ncbi:YqaJ viral recombinase family protein [Cupriavidus taiwanensis]|uniref:YqaJ viral recombinase family nuclease n=1 Tax=Cupriavidus taiwanensis TaxID=164546 RepID=UPI000E172CF5|nr:YqaJ viral recombinase family protein [Cupriavidus taiwanensis]SPA17214.1 Phage-type endonuclease [Cupriavidus taiwanensis]